MRRSLEIQVAKATNRQKNGSAEESSELVLLHCEKQRKTKQSVGKADIPVHNFGHMPPRSLLCYQI